MVTYKVLLDTRQAKSDGTYSVQIRITYNRKSSTVNTGVFVKESFWGDAQAKVLHSHPNAALLNKKTTEFYLKVQRAVLQLENEDNFEFGTLKERLSENYVTRKVKGDHGFKDFEDQLIAGMFTANETGNATVYQTATNRLMAYANNPKLRFVDINYIFLEGFKRQLTKQGIKLNSISNYFRTLSHAPFAVYRIDKVSILLIFRGTFQLHDAPLGCRFFIVSTVCFLGRI